MLRTTVLLAAMAAFCAPAMASESHLYGTIDFLRAEMRFDDPELSRQRVNGGALSLGYRVSPYLAVEVRGAQTRSTTVGSVPVNASQSDVRYGIEYAVGGYLKAIWPVDPGRIEPYVLVGATYGRSRSRIAGLGTFRESDTDLSYGIGTHLWANSRAGMKLEYTRYIDKSGLRLEAPHIGFIVRF